MKRFKGFTPEQQFTLLQKMGYQGAMNQNEMSNYVQANPEAQARLGKFADAARKRIEMMGSKPQFAAGGLASAIANSPELKPTPEKYISGAAYVNDPFNSPERIDRDAIAERDAKRAQAEAMAQPVATASPTEVPQSLIDAQAQTKKALENPTSLVTPTNVQQIIEQPSQYIRPGTGNAGTATQGTATTVDQTQTATMPDRFDAATVDPTKVTPQVQAAVDNLQAQTADPSAKATVRGQLEMLMQDFEGGGTPPWASGAMREAMSVMQRRGMGASSMAGAAVVQAAMESAIGIASQDAQINAQFEMQNLNNRQQTAIFKTQQTIAGMFSDQAADNAAKQFNAASKNQVNQFFADLESTVSRFNSDQVNAIRKFNAGEKNAMEQFNTQIKSAREEFNAKNDLIIAQANTKWRQDIATINTTAQNEANMEFARTANGLTARALDQIWQKERDIMAFAFTSSESSAQRKHELLMADNQIEAEEDASEGSAITYLAGRILFG
jgi:hypothetical protein